MRILLDSNVWRYFVDAKAIGALSSAVRRSRHSIAIAPAVLYEALRTGNPVIRAALVDAMTLPHWQRLMPEAFSESEEIRAEIRRLHPDWLRPQPDHTLYKALRYDWMRSRGGFWDRARKEADAERKRIDDGELLERARAQAVDAREESETLPKRWANTPLRQLQVIPVNATPGWDGSPVDFWRIDALRCFKTMLFMERNPYAEWLSDEVDLNFVFFDVAASNAFWLREIETKNMRRHWLRSAFEYQQRFQRVTDGTPGDSQLGTYLVEVDLMLSADGGIVRCAERCRAEAPFPLAISKKIPGGREAVDAVLAVLGSAPGASLK